MKQIEMKQKFLVIMLMLTVGLTACSLTMRRVMGGSIRQKPGM